MGNPGPGGYGAVLLSGPHRKELSQGFRLTTNNRMELTAVCAALEALKFEGSDVTVYSDSKYVVDAVTKGWVFGWEKKRFAGKKNPDLWMRFLRIYRRHNVRFVWVKGHADTVENNRCDQLAVAAANDKAHLSEDTGYEPEGRGEATPASFPFSALISPKLRTFDPQGPILSLLFLSLSRLSHNLQIIRP